jgi:hypothetical protein
VVQIDYDKVHLRTSLVQLFVSLLQNSAEVVQIIELKRFGGAPNGYPFAALVRSPEQQMRCLFNSMEIEDRVILSLAHAL